MKNPYESGSIQPAPLPPAIPQIDKQQTTSGGVLPDYEQTNDYDLTAQEKRAGCIYNWETLYHEIWTVPVI